MLLYLGCAFVICRPSTDCLDLARTNILQSALSNLIKRGKASFARVLDPPEAVTYVIIIKKIPNLTPL